MADPKNKLLFRMKMNAFNQFDNQFENQFENQNENAYYLYLLSVSVSDIGKSIINLLKKQVAIQNESV